jgi:hypothetical protein
MNPFTIIRSDWALLRTVSGTLRRMLLAALDQLGNRSKVVAKLQLLCASTGIRPERVDDLRGDTLRCRDFFGPRTAEYLPTHAVNGRRRKSDVPIAAAGRRRLQENFRVVQQTGTSNLRSFTADADETTLFMLRSSQARKYTLHLIYPGESQTHR